ncbi:VOC family protein [Chloroflexota bacterium]
MDKIVENIKGDNIGKNWKLRHVGAVVRDMDKAVEYYQSLGIAPSSPEHIIESKSLIDHMVYGKPADPNFKLKVRSIEIGSLMLELFQPVEGESVQKKFLESNDEGINHIAFTVDNLDKETAKLAEKGFKIIWGGRLAGGRGFAYFDTDKVGGIVFELVQRPPE